MSCRDEVFVAAEDIRAGDRVRIVEATGQVVRVPDLTGTSASRSTATTTGGMCGCDGPPHPYNPSWCR